MASEDHNSSREPSHAGGVKPSREAELQDLLARVEAAAGPDREIDCLIHEWRNPEFTVEKRGVYYGEPTGEYFLGDTFARAQAYTSSLDAALALVERALPGWGCIITLPLGGGGYAQVFDKTGREYDRHGEIGALSEWLDAGPCHSPTPPLALLAAMLAALIAQAASPESGPTGVWPNQSPTPLSKTEVQS